jgi:hypothetical protein
MSVPGSERRRSPRAALGVRVSALNGDVSLAIGNSHNISRHGMYVDFMLSRPDKEFDRGQKVALRFLPPTSAKPIDVRARVVRVVYDDNGVPSGIGVEFVNIGDEDLALIEEYIAASLIAGKGVD